MSQNRPAYALAVDIGGTSIRFGLINERGELLGEQHKYRVPFDAGGMADAHQLVDLMAQHTAQAREAVGEAVPIGVSLCGNVDIPSGEAVLVPNLHWRNVPFGPMIQQRCRVPVYVATDVRQAALAEAVWGIGKGVRNFVWATVGTGYGGYLFLDGRLYRGTHGFAGNFGHMTLDEIQGYPCGCGRWGCFETFVAGPAIAREGRLAVTKKRSPALTQLAQEGEITTHTVFMAAEAGDPAAQDIIDQAIRLICINLGGVVNILDVALIVMGGGVARAASWFVERVNERIRPYLMTVEAQQNLRVVPESLPNSALWGAAAHVFAAQHIISAAVLEAEG